MHSSLLTLTAAGLLTSVAAQTVHIVTVGGWDEAKKYTFDPSDVTAAAGDSVQFQIWQTNHTIVQSTFEGPCKPASDTAIASANFMVPKDEEDEIPTFTVKVADAKTPMYFYDAAEDHCQMGLVFALNAPADKNAAAYKAAAKSAPASVDAKKVGGGETAMIPFAKAKNPNPKTPAEVENGD